MTGVLALGAAYRAGTTTPSEVVAACLTRIEEVDPQLHAFTYLDRAGATSSAEERTVELATGRLRGPLHGVPIAIKELFDLAGAPADYGSLTRRGEVAERDAVVVERLRAAGAIVIGLTRSHEFGWGITTQHSRRGSTRNPWNLDRIPGGSSGGSAAAVAAGLVPVAIATDTGGSVRIPSAFCGVAGIKPSFGRAPRTGLVALAPSFDTVGVIGRRVSDLWPVLEAISGADDGDPLGATTPLGKLTAPRSQPDLAGVRLGHWPLGAAVSAESRQHFQGLLERATALGAVLVDVSLPPAEEFRTAFTTIQLAEAFDAHARVLQLYPRLADAYGEDVRGRLELGRAVELGDYLAAVRTAKALSARLSAAFADVDGLLSPIAPVAAPTVAEPDSALVNGVQVPLRDAIMGYLVPYNLTGLPSVAFRAGFDRESMPWGAQLATARGEEGHALAWADVLERASDEPDRWPAL